MSAIFSAAAQRDEPRVDANALIEAARAVAIIAAKHASEVDHDRRFPFEAISELRRQRLMSVAVPTSLGGAGASLATLVSVTRLLAEACASTAMIYAMHQSQIACLIDYAPRDNWHARLFKRLIAQQLLIASATSEETIGGDLRSSACAVLPAAPGRFTLTKHTPTISYGAHADVILVTARRHDHSPPGDQVLLTLLHQDYQLSHTRDWDTLGMRGTCSSGFVLQGQGSIEQMLPTSFGEIAERSMLPVSHILWSAAWLGIATDALRRGQKFYRQQARLQPGTIPPGGSRIADAFGMLRTMEAMIDSALALAPRDDRHLPSNSGIAGNDARTNTAGIADTASSRGGAGTGAYGMTIVLNDLKIRMSTMALEIVDQMMQFCGMAAYRNDSPFSLGRHLRDLRSAPLMINNDRLRATLSVLMLGERVR